MTLSAPIYRLKREAKRLSRQSGIPHHEALDRIAVREGFPNWGLLLARARRRAPAAALFPRLRAGDRILLAARPGHGKTLLALELIVEAMRQGHQGRFFSLEYTLDDLLRAFDAIGTDPREFRERFVFDDADAISAAHVEARLGDAPPGTVAAIDYLQLLDQRRENPDVAAQLRDLSAFAQVSGVILLFISQIDRAFEGTGRDLPGLEDVRRPNPLDLGLFTGACFLDAGGVRFERPGAASGA